LDKSTDNNNHNNHNNHSLSRHLGVFLLSHDTLVLTRFTHSIVGSDEHLEEELRDHEIFGWYMADEQTVEEAQVEKAAIKKRLPTKVRCNNPLVVLYSYLWYRMNVIGYSKCYNIW